jgi:hypothetical protein
VTNRASYRAEARAASDAAGFLIEEPGAELPEQFLLILRPR